LGSQLGSPALSVASTEQLRELGSRPGSQLGSRPGSQLGSPALSVASTEQLRELGSQLGSQAGAAEPGRIFSRLLGTASAPAVLRQELHTPQRHAGWFEAAAPAPTAPPSETTELDVALARTWHDCATEASRPRLAPSAFTQAAAPRLRWNKPGRHGTAFGHTVHQAIGLVLTAGKPIDAAVTTAAACNALEAHLPDAARDVARALATLRVLGVPENRYRLEYPISGRAADGVRLLAGYVDLVAIRDGDLLVLDFKTDLPPTPQDPPLPEYVAQVCGYASVLARAMPDRPVRTGLLFTADGEVRWIP
ncbi:MAG TPA: PD-(D/E)XK nuclease family protein, partial [Solirubrobacteraceae bacterium]|nr:PD-(D/E)XK nuclease family protein [Solirubrobacteraceae bacterium]